MRLRRPILVLILAAGACSSGVPCSPLVDMVESCRDHLHDDEPDRVPRYVVEVRFSNLAAYWGRPGVVEIVGADGRVYGRTEFTGLYPDTPPARLPALDATRVVAWIDGDADGTCDAPPTDGAWNVAFVTGSDVTVTIDARTPMTPACP